MTKPIFEINPFVQWSLFSDYDWIDYDFIFVDGPGPFMQKVKSPNGEIWEVLAAERSGDILFLLHMMKPNTIIYVDKRKVSTLLYDRHLCSVYKRDEDGKMGERIHLGYLEKLEGSPLHAIYRRTEKPLDPEFKTFENSDTVLHELTKGDYFND